MGVIDPVAWNQILDNNLGTTKGPNAPASHTLHLFAGDPLEGGTELTSAGGYVPQSISNNGSWPPAVNTRKVGPQVVFPASTGAWSAVATHWAMKGSDGIWSYTGRLSEQINVTAAGVTKTVRPIVYPGTRI